MKKIKSMLCVLGIALCTIGGYYANISICWHSIIQEYNESMDIHELSEIEKIHSMREYVYSQSVLASDEELLLNAFSYPIFGLTKKEKVVKMFQLNQNYRGGLYCDGFADMLAMFYQLMGYDAYRINLNVGGNTHCVTAVEYNEEWIIEDATFNYAYIANDENGLDDIICDLKSGGGMTHIVEGKNIQSFAIAQNVYEQQVGMYPILLLVGEKKGNYMYAVDRSVSNYTMYELMYPYFLQDGYEADFKFSLLYSEAVIWKYGIEDILFDYEETLEDVEKIEEILGKSK